MEQWVFVLPGADDASECVFFANPSIAGYDVSESTSVELTVDFGEEDYIYTVPLSATARQNWYGSEAYNIAKSAWNKDYKILVTITDQDGTVDTVELSKSDVSASWPEIREKTIRLKKDSDGQTQTEVLMNQCMKDNTDNTLFAYQVKNQTGCEVVLDTQKQCINIYNAEKKGEFTLAVTDPAGNEEVAEMHVVAATTGSHLGIGIIVPIIMIVVVMIVLLVKKKKVSSDGHSSKEMKIIEARESVDSCYQQLMHLTRKVENTLHEIQATAQVAEERIRQDGEISAYDIADIRTMVDEAENLMLEPCYENVNAMKQILGNVSAQLLKMQGGARHKPDNGYHNSMENPKNYLDAVKRQEILTKVENDRASMDNLFDEMAGILKTLKEIAYREEVPFSCDLTLTVTDGYAEYEARRACLGAYGEMAPGVFSLDTLRFLSDSDTWVTLPEILGKKTDIRIFAIDGDRMRAIAEKPIIHWHEKYQRIVEFSYVQDVVLQIRDAANLEIRLHFER